MQHEDISTWFILTLSAEQAVFDQDFEHLDALLKRREELLTKWEEHGVKIDEKDAKQIQAAELRLETAMRRVQEVVGNEVRLLNQRKRAASIYKAA